MQRWIIPASVVGIVIAIAALTILVATNSINTGQDTQQGTGQVEEPEPVQDPTPQPDDSESPAPGTPGGETSGALNEEDAAAGGQTTREEAPEPAIQPGPRTATIEITGDTAYYCSIGVIGDPRTVEGRQPTVYEVQVSTGGTALETVMAACQKISPGGTLGVNIVYDDEVVAQDETSGRLGTVSVSWSPLEE